MHTVIRLFVVVLLCTLSARAQVGWVAAFPCNEGSGSTIADVTATHHVGTLNNAGWTAQGK